MVYLYWMLMQYVPDFKRFLKNIWPGKIFLFPGKILKRDDLVFLLDGLSELAVRLLRVWGAPHLWRCSTNGCCATERWRVGISGHQGFLDCFFVFIFARFSFWNFALDRSIIHPNIGFHRSGFCIPSDNLNFVTSLKNILILIFLSFCSIASQIHHNGFFLIGRCFAHWSLEWPCDFWNRVVWFP